VLSKRQSHRTLVHHLDDLLLGVASSHRALEEGSLLVLGERISGLKQGSKCILPLLGAWGGGDGAAGSWGCLLHLPSGMRLSHPSPARSRDLPCGYIGDTY